MASRDFRNAQSLRNVTLSAIFRRRYRLRRFRKVPVTLEECAVTVESPLLVATTEATNLICVSPRCHCRSLASFWVRDSLTDIAFFP